MKNLAFISLLFACQNLNLLNKDMDKIIEEFFQKVYNKNNNKQKLIEFTTE